MIKKAFLLFFISINVANAEVLFSPYADLTINTRWDSATQDMEPTDLVEVAEKSGVKAFHLAFITDAGSCKPAWGAQSSYSVEDAWSNHLLKRMQKAGISYVISFGGASGNDISLACNNNQLVNMYEKTITIYNPTGLDFDIENGTANVANIMSALQTIQKSHPALKISFTLPVLPEGLTGEGQAIVKQAQMADLNFSVNIMAMDYGPAYNGDMGNYAIEAANNLYKFIKSRYPNKSDAECWAMVEVTPMIGVNDVAIEQFTLANADAVKAFANRNQLGGLAMWSVARDNPCADKWASPICSGNNLQTMPYEFMQHFVK